MEVSCEGNFNSTSYCNEGNGLCNLLMTIFTGVVLMLLGNTEIAKKWSVDFGYGYLVVDAINDNSGLYLINEFVTQTWPPHQEVMPWKKRRREIPVIKRTLIRQMKRRARRTSVIGICLGMQIAVIEFARSVLGLQDANSTEFDPNTPNPCVIFMPEGSKTHMGGTMRLGSRRTYFQFKDCKSAKL